MVLVVQSLEELKTLALELLVATHEDQPSLLIDGIDEALVEALGDIDGIGGGDQCCGTQGIPRHAGWRPRARSSAIHHDQFFGSWNFWNFVSSSFMVLSWRRASANWATMSARIAA
jgi:hypothetical protein